MYSYYQAKKELQSIQHLQFWGAGLEHNQMEENVNIYWSKLNEIVKKYCSSIQYDKEGRIEKAEGYVNEIYTYEEVIQVGDLVNVFTDAGGRFTGIVKEIRVYFNPSEQELDWEMKVEAKGRYTFNVNRYQAPQLAGKRMYA